MERRVSVRIGLIDTRFCIDQLLQDVDVSLETSLNNSRIINNQKMTGKIYIYNINIMYHVRRGPVLEVFGFLHVR